MTRYYSNSINNLDIRKNLAIYTTMTYITTQTYFALTNRALFKSILRSSQLRSSNSRFFLEGEYTFAFKPIENGSCIELTLIGFNSTN